jgi:PAS domain S-box-containing protein
MAVKPKTTSKKSRSEQSDLFHLAENIILNVGVGIYIVQHGKFVYVSKLYQKIIGYSDTKLIGTYSLDYIYPDDREMVREQAIKRLKGKSSDPYEYRFIRKNNEVMWALEMVTSIIYKGERATLGSFLDITERKRTVESLQLSEEKYRTIIEEINEGYYEIDLAGSFTFFNDTVCSMTGYSREELTGMNNRQYADEKTAKELYRLFNEVYRTGKSIKRLDHETLRKDGSKIFTEISVSLIRDSEGKPIGFRGLTRDINERKLAEAALRKSEEKYRTILENIEDGYYEIDLAGNFTFFNDSMCQILGYTKEELMGMNNRQYTDKEVAKKVFQAFNKVYNTREPLKG